MKPEFHYTMDDYTARFEVICGTPEVADRVRREFPAICGSPLRRVNDTLFFNLSIDRLDGAIIMIEEAGYPTIDLAADTSYAANCEPEGSNV